MSSTSARDAIKPRKRRQSKTGFSLPYTEVADLLNVSAIAHYRDPLGREKGDPLDPLRHGAWQLEQIFATVGPRETAAMWQQTPRPAEGSLFSRDYFQGRIIAPDMVPKDLKWCRFWDWAYSEPQVNKGDPDYSVGAKVAIDYDVHRQTYKIYLGHIARLQKLWSDVKTRVADTALHDGAITYVGGEANGPQKAACDDILKMPDMLPYVFWPFPTMQDKVSKAQPWLDRARQGFMYLVDGEWLEDFYDEGEAFPNGSHDDIIDAVSGAYIMASNRTRMFDTEVATEPSIKRW